MLTNETDGFVNSASTTLTLKEMLALSVTRQGNGSGTVASSPDGINCGSICTGSYLSDSQVTLTAAPDANSVLAEWTGCDSVVGASCTVTMNTARLVTVTFNLNP